ncbi:hypothetical protein D9M71_642690 [compost metagenome]
MAGQHPAKEAAKEDPDQGRGRDHALPETAQTQIGGHLHHGHADDAQYIAIQNPATTRADTQQLMEPVERSVFNRYIFCHCYISELFPLIVDEEIEPNRIFDLL